ncbi:hypothetical protein ISS37_00205 [candidate division KSB1 bacterium]|nr:hypothetical protein [candidate division KSB1 bacterium]
MAIKVDLSEFKVLDSPNDIEVPDWMSRIRSEDMPEFIADIVKAYLYGLRTGDFSKAKEELETWRETVELCYDLPEKEEVSVRWRDLKDV